MRSKATPSSHYNNKPIILAIDIGTSSVRATLFDRVGREISGSKARRRLTIQSSPRGAAEIDADRLLGHVWECIDDVLKRIGAGQSKICGVATCTFVSNILGIDRHGIPRTPLITYADTRSRKDVVRLRQAFDETSIHDRTGCYFHTSYLPVLSAMAPDAHGLTVLPFLSGERSPGWAGYARATLHGLSLATTPMDILRAGLEAVAYRVGIIYGRLSSIIPDEAQVVASGGALRRSPVWLQILADVLGKPIAVSDVREASSRGAALLALESLGVLSDLDAPPPLTGKRVLPNREHHVIYRKAIKRQQILYDRLVANYLNSTEYRLSDNVFGPAVSGNRGSPPE